MRPVNLSFLFSIAAVPLIAGGAVLFIWLQDSESPHVRHRDGESFADLRNRTFRAIEQDPSKVELFFDNATEFLSRPDYHAEVLQRLEKRVPKKPSHGGYWVLALTCESRAVATHFNSDDAKRRYLHYYEQESDAGLPKQNDEALIAKTIQYYKKAAELAEADWWRLGSFFYPNFYRRQLVQFYSELNRHADAIDLCKVLAKRQTNLTDASFLLAYGEVLFAAGNLDEAEQWLSKVRPNDHEGHEHGPACNTIDAETSLGLIALRRGKIDKAVEYLRTSTRVEKCCHDTTKGFPTGLASQLLEHGQSTAVAEFCETVLRDFTPHAEYLTALLTRAKLAGDKKPKS